MNLLLALPFVTVTTALLLPLLFLDGGRAYLAFIGRSPGWGLAIVATVGIPSYWLARRLSQTLLLRSAGAKLRATHEPP